MAECLDRWCRPFPVRGLLLISCLMVLCGCGGAPKPPKTLKVKGVVKFEGQPLSKGAITFQAKAAGEGTFSRPAMGQIQSDGTYELGTFTSNDGIVPGDYSVVITSYDSEPTAEEFAAGAKRKSSIPEKYTNSITSGLFAKISADESEPVIVDFDLKK